MAIRGGWPTTDHIDVGRIKARLTVVASRPRAVQVRPLYTVDLCELVPDKRLGPERLHQQAVQIAEVRRLSVRPKDPLTSDSFRANKTRLLESICLSL